MQKRTKKQEKEFQEQLKKDRRNFAIWARTQLVREALFLINKGSHKLTESVNYFDCSQHPDFDDLHHNVYDAQEYIKFAMEKLEEISERDLELNPKEADNGRGKRTAVGPTKKRNNRKN